MIEAALAHVVRNRVEAAYARSDLFERRRVLMDDWARYLAQRPGGGPGVQRVDRPKGSVATTCERWTRWARWQRLPSEWTGGGCAIRS